ncbi:MAG: phosphorylase [Terriglobales bacterium]
MAGRWSGIGLTDMPPPRVAIVAAMEREVGPLFKNWRRREAPEALNGAACHLSIFEGKVGFLVVGGIGAAAAGRAARLALELASAEVLVSAGSAGALKPELKVGDIVRPATVIDAATGARFVSQGGKGTLVTSGAILGPQEKKEAASRFAADAVDMEAAAVAAVAQERGVGFLAIKAISDELDFVLPPINQFVDSDGQFQTGRFVRYLALRPRWWAPVKRMAADSKRAAANLCAALEGLELDVKSVK